MQTLTDERGRQIPAGASVTVTTPADYTATGRLLGLIRDHDGPKIRVLAADGLERRVPLPARITTPAA